MVKKRFMVCVIDVTEDTVRIRMPDGTIGTLKNEPVFVTDDAGKRELPPLKVGDEIPASIKDNGNLLIHFAERRSA